MSASEAGKGLATVWPVYSNGRRKAGRAPNVHHWEIGCATCGSELNLRPERGWVSKVTLERVAKQHNAMAHPESNTS